MNGTEELPFPEEHFHHGGGPTHTTEIEFSNKKTEPCAGLQKKSFDNHPQKMSLASLNWIRNSHSLVFLTGFLL